MSMLSSESFYACSAAFFAVGIQIISICCATSMLITRDKDRRIATYILIVIRILLWVDLSSIDEAEAQLEEERVTNNIINGMNHPDSFRNVIGHR